MISTHKILFTNSNNLKVIPSKSVGLVITSPPYPMIEMWDESFKSQNAEIKEALENDNGPTAFELMHLELDRVWSEAYRVLEDGGIACINIGDATRTIGKRFQLYSNHARILSYCLERGFGSLPPIIWRKQTNAPNKFMGSGMLPPGAYVTLEHEFILVLRKGDKREFRTSAQKLNRSQSAFFWEERNIWFSDVWDFKGTRQQLNNDKSRNRSAAFPFELAYRLINMFSVKLDTVLDPFVGTGTTTLAAMASCRNSIGVEIDPNFQEIIESGIDGVAALMNDYIQGRLERHLHFVQEYEETKKELKYKSKHYGFPVMTRQEIEIIINYVRSIIKSNDNEFEVDYLDEPLLKMAESSSYDQIRDNADLLNNKTSKPQLTLPF